MSAMVRVTPLMVSVVKLMECSTTVIGGDFGDNGDFAKPCRQTSPTWPRSTWKCYVGIAS
jgi:hypothetical protein